MSKRQAGLVECWSFSKRPRDSTGDEDPTSSSLDGSLRAIRR